MVKDSADLFSVLGEVAGKAETLTGHTREFVLWCREQHECLNDPYSGGRKAEGLICDLGRSWESLRDYISEFNRIPRCAEAIDAIRFWKADRVQTFVVDGVHYATAHEAARAQAEYAIHTYNLCDPEDGDPQEAVKRIVAAFAAVDAVDLSGVIQNEYNAVINDMQFDDGGLQKTPVLVDPVTVADLAALLMLTEKRIRNVMSSSAPPDPAIREPNRVVWSYATIRPWLVEQWSAKAPRLPESYHDAKKILSAEVSTPG